MPEFYWEYIPLTNVHNEHKEVSVFGFRFRKQCLDARNYECCLPFLSRFHSPSILASFSFSRYLIRFCFTRHTKILHINVTLMHVHVYYCCRGQAISITYSECVSVALFIPHASAHTLLHCHVRPVCLYHIFPYHLMNSPIFGKRVFFLKQSITPLVGQGLLIIEDS